MTDRPLGWISAILLGIIVGLIIGGLFFSSFFESDDQKLTESYILLEKTVVQESSKSTIEDFIVVSSQSNTSSERLNKIADLIVENFSAGLWDHSKYQPIGNSRYYGYNTKGQVYIYVVDDSNRELSINPYWIMYQKTGACKELSILFDFIAKKAGYTSRIVRTGNGDANGFGATHWWNEVVINGQNITFDPLYYGQIKYGVSQGKNWSGNRSSYTKGNSNDISIQQICDNKGVWITNPTGKLIEDITADYTFPERCN